MTPQKIYDQYNELKRTNPKSSHYKAKVISLKDKIKQFNYHEGDRFRLVEIKPYREYELREV